MEGSTQNPSVDNTASAPSAEPKLVPLKQEKVEAESDIQSGVSSPEENTKVIDISVMEKKKKKVNLVFGAVLLGLIIAISFLVLSPRFLKTALVENADGTLRLEATPMTISGVGGTSLVTIIMNTGSNPNITTVTPYINYPVDMFDVVEDDVTPPTSPSPYWGIWSVYRNQIDKTTGKIELSLSCDPSESPPADTDIVLGTFTVSAQQLGTGTIFFDNVKSVLLLADNTNVLHETTPVTITVGAVQNHCADTSGDGVYDSCTTTGTGPACATDTECQNITTLGCNTSQQCVQGGTGATCATDTDCGAVQNYCDDGNNDGVYDACTPTGTGALPCSSLTECTTGNRCNIITHQCVAGGVGNTCVVDADCAADIRYCEDTDDDNVYDSCSALLGIARCDNQPANYCTSTWNGCNMQTLMCVVAYNGPQCAADPDCAARVRYCADENNDGQYDACSATTGTVRCDNHPADFCWTTAVHACNYSNQCVPGGTGAGCFIDSDCRPARNHCADTSGDGVYDSCTTTGTGPACATDTECQNITTLGCNTSQQCVQGGTGATCATDTDCGAVQNRCDDTDDNGVYDICSATGTGAILCSGSDATPCTTGNRCNPVLHTCVAGGIGPTCTSDTECQLPQQHCDDLNYDGTYDACSQTGTGALICNTNTDCTTGNRCNPYNQTCVAAGIGIACTSNVQCSLGRCSDSNRDGVYDRCLANGTGPYCNTNTDCTSITQRGCNRSNQCVPGGTGSSCTRNSDCGGGGGGGGGPGHYGCFNNACIFLTGSGTNTCITNADCVGNENINVNVNAGGAVTCFTPLSLQGTTSGTSVMLTWTLPNDPNITGINVYYGTSPDNLSIIQRLGRVNTATVTGLTDKETYYFVITAVGNCIESNYSNMVGIQIGTGVLPGPFNPPTPGPVLPQTGAGIGIALAGVGFYWLRKRMKK